MPDFHLPENLFDIRIPSIQPPGSRTPAISDIDQALQVSQNEK
jgi:hypothetical protein